MTEYDKECLRSTMERKLNDSVGELVYLLQVNELRSPDTKVHTLTWANDKNGCFLAVNGSAHQMHEHFEEFFRERPEFRRVVQDVLDNMYKIDNR